MLDTLNLLASTQHHIVLLFGEDLVTDDFPLSTGYVARATRGFFLNGGSFAAARRALDAVLAVHEELGFASDGNFDLVLAILDDRRPVSD